MSYVVDQKNSSITAYRVIASDRRYLACKTFLGKFLHHCLLSCCESQTLFGQWEIPWEIPLKGQTKRRASPLVPSK